MAATSPILSAPRVGSRRQRPLVKAALLASGADTREQMARYLGRFKKLVEQIGQDMPPGGEVARAKYLFEWLWHGKPRRYQPGGCFRLTDVLEAQLAPRCTGVGNCLGLTVLYNSLAQRFGIRVAAVHLERSFHGIPHVLTLLQADGRQIDVENITPDGFDYSGHKGEMGREKWGGNQLVADIYLSRGNALFEARRWQEAIACYDAALELNLKYEKARLNRAIAVGQMVA